jgi:hypothetical protein
MRFFYFLWYINPLRIYYIAAEICTTLEIIGCFVNIYFGIRILTDRK